MDKWLVKAGVAAAIACAVGTDALAQNAAQAQNYDVSDKITVSVGAENLLDRYPHKAKQNLFPATGSTQFGGFYPDSTISTNGMFWYGKISAQF